MIHIENIPHILQYGITKKSSPNANPNFTVIGDMSLIDTRSAKIVPVDNGDFLMDDPPKICLGDFIPFYFGIKMPMLYVMQNGGNFVERATPPRDIVYLACALNKVIQSDIVYYFSDGHGTDNLTTFYDSSKTNKLPVIVDWSSIRAGFWGGHENLNTKRKKQAEFLVSDDLPRNFITGFVCYNELAKERLTTMGINDNQIKVVPGAYY